MAASTTLRGCTIVTVFLCILHLLHGHANSQGLGDPPIQMIEQAHDGNYVVLAGQKTMVDANSHLVIPFADSTIDRAIQTDPEWQRLNTALKKVLEMGRMRDQLSAEQIDLTDTTQVKNLLKRIRSQDDQVSILINKVLEEDFGFQDTKIESILAGTFDNKKNPRRPYDNLARWLKQEIEKHETELRTKRENLLTSRALLKVTVQAFCDPMQGNRRALHIEGYDNLPNGQLSPIEGSSLRLTPAERGKFNAELKGNQDLVTLILEAPVIHDALVKHGGERLADLEASLRSVEGKLKTMPRPWAARLDSIITQLQQLASKPEPIKGAAQALIGDLKAFQSDFKTLKSVLDLMTDLGNFLETSGSADLAELLSSEEFSKKLQSLDEKADSLNESSKTWQGRFGRIQENVKKLGEAGSQELIQRILPQEVQSFFKTLGTQFPPLAHLVSIVSALREHGGDYIKGTGTLGSTEANPIWYPIYSAPNARIELDRAEWALGDEVTVKVCFKEPDKDSGITGQTVYEQTYTVQATLMGAHREISSAVIFARGVGSNKEGRKWKPNVAAIVNGYYSVRNPQKPGKFWNWLSLGLGAHLASLDQGKDSVEFGFGANFSLWKGLFAAGYGWNLSEDQGYIFVGLDLFDILTRRKF